MGAKAERTREGGRMRISAARPPKRSTGTPRPRTIIEVAAGLLARGSSPPSGLPGIAPS